MAFNYINLNPLSLEQEDCVIRAISLASGYSYAEIQDKLYYMSQLLECDPLCVGCYQHLLDDIFKYDRVGGRGLTVQEIADLYDDCILLVRIEGHLTCCVYGKINDTWDSGDYPVDIVWVVN